MEEQTTTNTQEGWGKINALWSLALLPVLYMLSFGPVIGLVERCGTHELRDRVALFYQPVLWLHDHTPLRTPLEKYYTLCGGGK